jgi:hypothetical protein
MIRKINQTKCQMQWTYYCRSKNWCTSSIEGLMLFFSPPFFSLLHTSSFSLIVIHQWILWFFYSHKQKEKESRSVSLFVSVDSPAHMCRTIDDEIIDIIFCHMIRSTDAEVIYKTNISITRTYIHENGIKLFNSRKNSSCVKLK